jgi:hypothetical protein
MRPADTTTEMFRAGNYAKITARGCGQYQRLVAIVALAHAFPSSRLHDYAAILTALSHHFSTICCNAGKR